jgi:hypothetical protein
MGQENSFSTRVLNLMKQVRTLARKRIEPGKPGKIINEKDIKFTASK